MGHKGKNLGSNEKDCSGGTPNLRWGIGELLRDDGMVGEIRGGGDECWARIFGNMRVSTRLEIERAVLTGTKRGTGEKKGVRGWLPLWGGMDRSSEVNK